MSREKNSSTSPIDAYDLGSKRQRERYGLIQTDMDDDDGEGGSGSSQGQIEVAIPFSEPKQSRYVPLVDEWGQELARLVQDKADEFTQLLIEGQSRFGAVSTQRKKNKKSQEKIAANENQANLAHGNSGGGDLPQHPLLNGQRYDGMADNDSPLAARSAQDELFDNLSDQMEKHPELKLSPELSNDLKLRIELYNRQKLENALKSRPTLTMDHSVRR